MQMADVVEKANSVEKHAAKRLAELGRTADEVVRRHPWKTAGAAATLGVALTFLFLRRT